MFTMIQNRIGGTMYHRCSRSLIQRRFATKVRRKAERKMWQKMIKHQKKQDKLIENGGKHHTKRHKASQQLWQKMIDHQKKQDKIIADLQKKVTGLEHEIFT
jgi:cytochrome c556